MRPGLEGGGNWDENFFLEYDFTHFSGDALGHLGDILQWKWAPTMKIPPPKKRNLHYMQWTSEAHCCTI